MKKYLFFVFGLMLFFIPTFKSEASTYPSVENFKDYVILKNSEAPTYLITPTSTSDSCKLYADISSNGNMYLSVLSTKTPTSTKYCDTSRYVIKGDKWVLHDYANSPTAYKFLSLKYSTQNVINSSTGDVYFAKKLVALPLVPLFQIVAQVEMGAVLEIVLALVGSVVSLIILSLAFKKSWNWLLNLLLSS